MKAGVRLLASRSHLPHGARVLARLDRTLVHGLGSLLPQVVDGHAAIIETHRHQVGELLIDVQAQYARSGAEDVLGERGVL